MPAPFTFADAREVLTPQGNGVIPGFAEPSGDAQQRPDVADGRDPDHSRLRMFAYHNCWRCDHGAKPCVNGAPNLCGNPRARND